MTILIKYQLKKKTAISCLVACERNHCPEIHSEVDHLQHATDRLPARKSIEYPSQPRFIIRCDFSLTKIRWGGLRCRQCMQERQYRTGVNRNGSRKQEPLQGCRYRRGDAQGGGAYAQYRVEENSASQIGCLTVLRIGHAADAMARRQLFDGLVQAGTGQQPDAGESTVCHLLNDGFNSAFPGRLAFGCHEPMQELFLS